jgi:hypothetical protein
MRCLAGGSAIPSAKWNSENNVINTPTLFYQANRFFVDELKNDSLKID